MKDKKGVMAAIFAAVTAYIEEEEKARLLVPRRRPAPAISLWRFSGREEIMRMRALWQRRIT